MDLDAIAALDLLQSALVPIWENTVLATTTEPENTPLVLAGVLLSLVAIYLVSKIGGELSNLIGLPPVLRKLVSGVLVSIEET